MFDDGFGGKDEQLLTDHFVSLVGGVAKADMLMQIWNDSYPCGTKYDFLQGTGKTKVQVFKAKAIAEGFNNDQIMCFLEL